MKIKLLTILSAALLFACPKLNFAQTINLGTAIEFELYTEAGAITNTGISHITGNVGSNGGGLTTGFSNINGSFHDGDTASVKAKAGVDSAYADLSRTRSTLTLGLLIGTGQTLNPGVDSIPGNGTISGVLNLDAGNNANAVFIIKVNGTLAANGTCEIKLLNGALACNVFWDVEGAINILAGANVKGTFLANNAAISFLAGTTLEGRALSTTGAITLNSLFGYTPIGCGSPFLSGPLAPPLGSLTCFALLTEIGALTNTLTSHIIGDIGVDNGPLTGFPPGVVVGAIHAIAAGDAATHQGKIDMDTLYNYIGRMPADITLTDPVNFGNSLVLTPHTYVLLSATKLTDTVFFNAEGDPSAIFVVQVKAGALTTTSFSKVELLNGAQASNIYWRIEGAASIANGSSFKGTIVASGAIDFAVLDTLDGRALAQNGSITLSNLTMAITAPNPTISASGPTAFCGGGSVTLTASSGVSYSWNTGATTQSIVVTVAGNYFVVVQNSCGGSGTSITETITTNPSPNANTGGPATVCGGGPTTIGAASVVGDTYAWTSNPIGFTSTLSNPTVSPLVTTTYNLTETNTASGCSKTNSVVVTVGPAPVANAGPNVAVCSNTAVNLGSPTIAGDTYAWSSTPAGFTSLIANPIANPLVTTTYTVAVTNTASGCNNTDTVKITVSPSPNANAGSNASLCNGGTVGLGAPGVVGNTYAWTSNPIGFTSTLSNPSVSPLVTTTYSLTETVTASGCSKTNSVVITVNPTPNANTGPNASVCLGSSTVIGTPAVVGDTYSWTSNPVGFTSTLANPTVNPIVTTIYTLTETVTATSCTKSNSVTITVNPLPTANAGSNGAVCNGSSTIIGAPGVAGNTYSWTSNPVGFTSTVANPTVSPIVTTTYTLTETTTATGCNNSNMVTITVTPSPNAFVGPNDTLCVGMSVTLGGASVVGDTYSWVSNPVGFTSMISNPSVNPTVNTIYTLTETNTATGCTRSNSVTVVVKPLPTAGFTSSLTGLTTYDFTDVSINAMTYAWNFGDGQTSTLQNPSNTYAMTGIYTVTLTASNSCGTDAVIEVLRTNIDFYNGFSPNGDGYNDFWNIPVLNFYTSNTVTIINRWGSEVWRASSYDNETTIWTGKNMNGEDLPDGTYYYIITYNNTEKRGWVFIKR